jgi:hypothetical protein
MVTPVTKPWAETGGRRVVVRLRRRMEGCIVVSGVRGSGKGGGDAEAMKLGDAVVHDYMRVTRSRDTVVVGHHG